MTSSYNVDLKPLVKNWFGIAYKDKPSFYDKVFKVEKSSDAYEVDAHAVGMGLLQEKSEGGSISYDQSNEEYKPRYTHTSYALGFVITKEAVDDLRAMGQAKRFTEMLKRSALHSRETICAQVLNRAFNSTYTMPGGDGKELCATDHPTRNGNQANELATSADFSEAALEQANIDLKKLTDARGFRIHIRPRALLIPVDLSAEANRIVHSDKRVSTADNDLNYISQSAMLPDGIIESSYLTDTDAWLLLTDCDNGLKYLDRQQPEIDSDNDFDTKNARFSVMMRFSQGWSNHLGIFGSPGA